MSDNETRDRPLFTEYHAAYFAHELTKRSASDDVAKLGPSLFNATVDLNPHQLDAALFAFQSPLSRGAILADEVGLGKTIEAGLIISQLWAEHKRKILVIAPTILRKQWAQELHDKFFIDSIVLDSKAHTAAMKAGKPPMEPRDLVVICSYQFARARATEVQATCWDLVVIDEAHRLRNVYKSGNKIATAIRDAIGDRPKILLTATPLQNNLLELYGLVSFVDVHLFGSIDAFRARYMRGPIEERQFKDLKERLAPVCQRTLRRQVQEYVRFTNRIPLTQDFTPTTEEQEVYERVSEYLRREKLFALPNSQRKLMTLILRKLLASSSFAIAQTLQNIAKRLKDDNPNLAEVITDDFETADEELEEWSESDAEATPSPIQGEGRGEVPALSDNRDVRDELLELVESTALAQAIGKNAKGDALLIALRRGFETLKELNAAEKAVIFTESKRTQQYLIDLLNASGYSGRVLTINGTNTDDRAGVIYKAWANRHRGEAVVTGNKQVDLRAALVEHFRDHADILVATEAAAEGVNLQFCSLVVNYDLPWNPQRVEQRIGRCHRYGQQHDVVVVNFLNRGNEADMRVFELLSEKFRLFDGIFGSSDEILGALESGVDFERRIAEIYQTCRSGVEIDTAFSQLQLDLDEQISARLADTRSKLLENFDEIVRARLRSRRDETERELDNLQRHLWALTRSELADRADFDDQRYEFVLNAVPEGCKGIATGPYRFISKAADGQRHEGYRMGHPLAQHIIARAKTRSLPVAQIVFDYSAARNDVGMIGMVVERVGQSGWMTFGVLTVDSLDSEDRLLFAAVTDAGVRLPSEFGASLFKVRGAVDLDLCDPAPEFLREIMAEMRGDALGQIESRNNRYFDDEVDKLDRWADDLKHGLESELKDLDIQIKQAQRDAKLSGSLDAKLAGLKRVRELESLRAHKRRELFTAQDEVEAKKEALIANVEARLQQTTKESTVMTIRWHVV